MTRQVEAPYFARCEPSLADLLSDPILQMLMAKDRVQSRDLQALIDGVRNIAVAAGGDDAAPQDSRSVGGNSSPLQARPRSQQ